MSLTQLEQDYNAPSPVEIATEPAPPDSGKVDQSENKIFVGRFDDSFPRSRFLTILSFLMAVICIGWLSYSIFKGSRELALVTTELEKVLVNRAFLQGQMTLLQNHLKEKDIAIGQLTENLRSARESHQVQMERLKRFYDEKLKALENPPVLENLKAQGLHASKGMVLTVHPAQHFVIVDKGFNQGAHEGQWIQIYQKGTLLGKGKLERVYQNLSAATFASEYAIGQVEKGDQAYFIEP